VASARGLPGACAATDETAALRSIVQTAARTGVRTLTLYAFACADPHHASTVANGFQEPFQRYLETEAGRCVDELIRVRVIGRRERLAPVFRDAVERSERLTAAGSRLQLRIVLDYSRHDSILRDAWRVNRRACLTPESFGRALQEIDDSALPAGAVDLFIRTGATVGFSDFLLWEVAHAEFLDARCPWPELDAPRLRRAIEACTAPRKPASFLPAAVSRDPFVPTPRSVPRRQ
jgi:undecaprenyl diphosphate synthase